ncbi:VAMP-associated protein [Schizopora paradoxa]|uniref:VAMP-associated protein n=1 Tax=Schizopora paradoxa TaxID=27342 RepID=A0A0H2SG02_9AGAM|nr:VAMP-associated protein [Schizopora paradoxa]
MSVSLKPNAALGFNRPLTQLVKRSLTVTNNNDQPVAFKVKTTAPKLYCVRPNSGRIEPGESEEVQVMLQAMKEEPPLTAKCKDKFLVQSTIITPEKESMPLHDFWNNIEDKDNSIHQQKIKVVYLPQRDQDLPEEDEMPSSFANDSRYQTIRDVPPSHISEAAGYPLPQEPQEPLDRAFSPAAGDYAVPAEEEEISPPVHHLPPPPPPPAMPMPQHSPNEDELRSQLEGAQAEIERLRLLLSSVPELGADSELRRRNRPQSEVGTTVLSSAGESDVGTAVEQAIVHQEGVPPGMVIAIASVVFLLTYIFF